MWSVVLFIHLPLDRHLYRLQFMFWRLWMMPLYTFSDRFSREHVFIPLGKHLEVGFLDHVVRLVLPSQTLPNPYQSGCIILLQLITFKNHFSYLIPVLLAWLLIFCFAIRYSGCDGSRRFLLGNLFCRRALWSCVASILESDFTLSCHIMPLDVQFS